MAFFAQRIDENGRELLGTDNGSYFYDLKTVAGVKNRLRKGKVWNKGIWVIYKFPESEKFNEEKWKEVARFKLGDR